MKKLLVILTVLVFLISCGNKVSSGTSNGKSATFNVEAEPTSLDPQLLTDTVGFQISDMAYEGLVRLNEKNEIVPSGAESWTTSEDGKVWTFKIRKGMKWSNGDDLTVHDYVRAMKRALEPATAAEYAFIMYYIEGAEDYNTGKSTDFNTVGIKALDNDTLEIKLSKPAPYFIKTLVMPVYFPINEKALADNGEAYATEADKSVYSGPYIIKEWVHENKVVLEKNPNYWNKDNIKLDTLTALMVSDYDAATNLFENKELDLTKISIEKMENYKDKPELVKVPNGRVYYLAFNDTHPALKNIKVRQALALAINRDELVNNVLNGAGIKGSGIVANGMNGISGDFREEAGDLYEQYKDLDVKKLFDEGLKEVGMTPDQVQLTLTVDDKGLGKKEGEFYQAQWKEKLGIDVNVEVLTYKERIARGNEKDFDIIRYAWGPDYADPMTYVEIFISTAKGINIAQYNNPEYDKLMLEGQTNQNEAERIEAMKKGEKIVMDSFIYSGLYYEIAMFIKNPNLEGVTLRSIGNAVDFYRASMK